MTAKKYTKEILRLKNVFKTYMMGNVEFHALQDVSFEIEDNDYMVILGPSGSGKSTLLHICGLLDSPTKGEVYFENKNVKDYSLDELAEIRYNELGFVFQSFYLIPTLSAIQNVMLPTMFYDVPSKERFERAKNILKDLDMGDKLYNLPSELSGGQQQRVSIARAFVNNPKIIFADEPTGNLDSKSGESVLKILDDFHKAGKTIVIITHDINITKRKNVNKVVYIRDGRVYDK
ncbi:ABC transporter ATP-binding protein [Candidatus Micrarchaeota archaeon]|nr:ABC transporter ATP-binding protein [Candidatus Micrarchaeota archaeon]